MADEISSLQIKVDSAQVDKARASLVNMANAGVTAGKATDKLATSSGGLGGKLAAMAGAAGGAAGAMLLFKKAIDTTVLFQGLQAGLTTATGSAENAEKAFAALQVVASETPYDLAQVTTGFTKLVNYGLEPSKRAIMAYGDTASSMNKSLNDMIEAVADAATGEFERLKEFGIKARSEGDKVTFTFRGVKTEVGKNAKEIEQYLIQLGEKNFAGGMARQMDTMGGAISNVKDAWDVFLFNFMTTSGVAEGVEDAIRGVTEVLTELTNQIKSGEFQHNLEAWGIGWNMFVESFKQGSKEMRTSAKEDYDGLFDDSKGVWEDIIAYLQAVPISATTMVKDFATRLWLVVTVVKEVGSAMFDTFKTAFDAIKNLTGAAATAISLAFKGNLKLAGETLAADFSKTITDSADSIAKRGATMLDNINIEAGVAASEYEKIWKDAGDKIDAQQAAREQADKDRAEYDAGLLPPKGAIPTDPLAKFRVGGGEDSGGSSSGSKGGKGKTGTEFDQLVKDLQREEDAIASSYAERLDMIQRYTTEGSTYQGQLTLSLIDQWEEESMRYIDAKKRDADTLFEGLQEEEQLIETSYAKRKETILAMTAATEEEKAKLLDAAARKYTRQMAQHNQDTATVYLASAKQIFEDLSSIGDAFGKKGFKIAQAAAIALATVKMYESAVSAYSNAMLIPYVGIYLAPVAAAAALAAGAANIASIKAQEYSGKYEHGGMIPSGSYGLVGEAGPELVRGPAVVSSARTTADRGDSRVGGDVIINVSNYSGQPVEQRVTQTDDRKTIDLIIGEAENRIANSILKGGTKVSRAIESTYPVRRGAR